MYVKQPQRSAGFSLIEVMVALAVCAVGLLGLAKMESLALSSTNVAGSRSIAAIMASSLGAAMHGNQGYWAAGLAPANFTVQYSGTAPVITGSTVLATTTNSTTCTTPGTGACSPALMAAFDVQDWGTALSKVLPGYLATVNCSTGGFPVTCTIVIQWTENAVAANSAQTNMSNFGTTAALSPTYTLFVQP